jgi:hypothetical protein
MGTWASGLFSDDLACDIRDEYRDYIANGKSDIDATETLLQNYKSLSDKDEAPIFWLALAATQWSLGRLEQRVLNEALSIIETGTDLKRWEQNPKAYKKRKAILQKLRERLKSPQPARKKVKKQFKDFCDWQIGELISYRLKSDKTVIFQVVSFHEDLGGKSPLVVVLDYIGGMISDISQLNDVKLRPSLKKYKEGEFAGQSFYVGLGVFRHKEKDLPAERLSRLGKIDPLWKADSNKYYNEHLKQWVRVIKFGPSFEYCSWTNLDENLERIFAIS